MGSCEIVGDTYRIEYDTHTLTVHFQGSLRLSGPGEYEPIAQLLEDLAEQEPEEMTLDLQQLEFLNSSGISMLSKFVINIRKKKSVQVVVLGSNDIPWQGKSLKNLQRLLPGLKLELI